VFGQQHNQSIKLVNQKFFLVVFHPLKCFVVVPLTAFQKKLSANREIAVQSMGGVVGAQGQLDFSKRISDAIFSGIQHTIS